MLVIISDLHLTDGTDIPTLPAGALELFAQRLNDMAERASWRTNGSYQPLDRIDLVLLGDVLDLTRSSHWLQGDARPWNDPRSPAVAETVRRVVGDILVHNADSLQYLRALASHGGVALPPGSTTGQPVFGAELLAVPVHTHYMVGSHDWLLHLPGEPYAAVRRQVAQHLGLVQDGRQPFPHDPTECQRLQHVLRRHRVVARHGDIFDPIHYQGNRNESSLGDVLTIELVGRFVRDIQQQMGTDLPATVSASLAELHHVRPLLLAPAWLAGLLERTEPAGSLRQEMMRHWDLLVDRLLQLEPVRLVHSSSSFDLIDGLQRSLLFRKRPPVGWGTRTEQWLSELRGVGGDSYWRHALGEPEFRNRRARQVVYGHTHRAESGPLDASFADGFALHQMYFNTGTWRRVYQATKWQAAVDEFVPSEAMTFLAFYQGDERGGRSFEGWSGTLASLPPASPIHRLDAGRTTHAGQESLPPSALPVRGPHFAAGAAAARTPAAY